MPGMDGFETAAQIREHPRFAKTPIIFVTAVNTTDLDRIRGYEIGAVDYVSVPVIPEILRAKVSVFVELHRKRRELERPISRCSRASSGMRAILETANDAIITIDADGDVQTANPAAERIFGYTAEETDRQNVKMLMPAAMREYDEVMKFGRRTARFAGGQSGDSGAAQGSRSFPLEVAISEACPARFITGIIRDMSPQAAGARGDRDGRRRATPHRQELHDGVSQELTGLTMMADALQGAPRRGMSPATESLAGAGSSTAWQRPQAGCDVSHGLPGGGGCGGIAGRLRRSRRAYSAAGRHRMHLPLPASVFVKDSLTATNLYHIVQEAANNALRHGPARGESTFTCKREPRPWC